MPNCPYCNYYSPVYITSHINRCDVLKKINEKAYAQQQVEIVKREKDHEISILEARLAERQCSNDKLKQLEAKIDLILLEQVEQSNQLCQIQDQQLTQGEIQLGQNTLLGEIKDNTEEIKNSFVSYINTAFDDVFHQLSRFIQECKTHKASIQEQYPLYFEFLKEVKYPYIEMLKGEFIIKPEYRVPEFLYVFENVGQKRADELKTLMQDNGLSF